MNIFENILYYQKSNRLISHLLFWLTVLLISVSSSKYYDGNQFTFGFAIVADGLFLGPQIIAAYFLTYFIIPKFFLREKYLQALLFFIIGSYIICVISRFLMVRVAEPLAGIAPKASETNIELLTDLPKLLYAYFFQVFSIAFVFMFIKLLKDQLEIQKHSLTLKKEKAEAELKMLKTQLNPHFLFNTLNNIYALSLTNSPVTSTAIGRLSEILDYILYRCNSVYVPVSGEVVLLNNYIGLEKLRYDERLIVNFTSTIEQDIVIAPLILLSLVENAFKHGAGNEIGDPVINIELTAQRDHFKFMASNSFNPASGKENNYSIGLLNLRQQLELIYPDNHNLLITQKDMFFTIILNIDL